jgi:ACR3 family arsenite efflux pump ArsB
MLAQSFTPWLSLSSVLLIAGIAVGSLIGFHLPDTGVRLMAAVDFTLLGLVSLLLFSIELDALKNVVQNTRFIGVALAANFVLVPMIGYGIAATFFNQNPLVMLELVIYFMVPCTDWFLSFTRLAAGNVSLGTALIPINMTIQLVMYPVYLQLFFGSEVVTETSSITNTLLHWFLAPLAIAMTARAALRVTLSDRRFLTVENAVDAITPWLTAALVWQLFAGNVHGISAHASIFGLILFALVCFFCVTFVLSELLARTFLLTYPDRALLTMTVAARNSPWMLGITVVAFPEQPLIYAALILGMLVEFPHLTLLRTLLLRTKNFGPEHPTVSPQSLSTPWTYYLAKTYMSCRRYNPPWVSFSGSRSFSSSARSNSVFSSATSIMGRASA